MARVVDHRADLDRGLSPVGPWANRVSIRAKAGMNRLSAWPSRSIFHRARNAGADPAPATPLGRKLARKVPDNGGAAARGTLDA